MVGGEGGVVPFSFLSFHHIFAHIHAMVLFYNSKCSPFFMLSNGLFFLALQDFVYELKVELYLN